jgi:hypothetical protein
MNNNNEIFYYINKKLNMLYLKFYFLLLFTLHLLFYF